MNRQILVGDVLEKIKEIPDESIDCEVTSPPYFHLRDYKTDGQWGLENNQQDYLDRMRKLMFEMKRVLKPTGSCFVNLGDSYGTHRSNEETIEVRHDKQEQNPIEGFDKSLMMTPWEFATQCRRDGWIIRNVIPWYKSNSMPQSVKDRFTNKWEPIFFMVKSRKYYFNLDAVRIPAISAADQKPFNLRIREAKRGAGQLKLGDAPNAWKMSEKEDKEYDKRGFKKQDTTLGDDGKPKANYKGFNQRYKERKYANSDQTIAREHVGDSANHTSGKNPGDVLFINPKPFPQAHFATFPVDLPLFFLRCACPPDGIVLDPFFGAGTVGVAAEILLRNWVGIELNKEYVKIANNRLKPYIQQQKVTDW